jgi:dihydroxyacetone kinase
MKGLSVTFIRVDEEFAELYDQPCDSAFYKKV